MTGQSAIAAETALLARPGAGTNGFMARRDDGTLEEEAERAVAGLPARLVYSLMKAAVSVAARSQMSMSDVVALTQLAYFAEIRGRHPRDLKKVSEILGLSLRSVGSLNQRLKEAFFAAENQVRPARRLTDLLVDEAKTLDELDAAAPDLSRAQIKRALEFLRDAGWLEKRAGGYSIPSRLRSYVAPELSRRIDGLNNQMETIASSVWSRFFDGAETAVGRTWSFAARSADLVEFIDRTIRSLRHGAIDLEETALRDGDYSSYSVTVAFAEVGEKT